MKGFDIVESVETIESSVGSNFTATDLTLSDSTVNDALVITTWVIFAIVVFSGIVMYSVRPQSKKKKTFLEELERTPILNDPEIAQSSNSNKANLKSHQNNDDLSIAKSDNGKQKKKSNRMTSSASPSKVDNYVSSPVVMPDRDSERSSELSGNMGIGIGGGGGVTEGTSAVVGNSDVLSQGVADRLLSESLKNVLKHGMLMNMHTAEGPKQINLFIVGEELQWRTVKLFTRKTHRFPLSCLEKVEWGKRTLVFTDPSCRGVYDDMCFSLVYEDVEQSHKSDGKVYASLDLQAVSKVERDALALGFSQLIDLYRSQRS